MQCANCQFHNVPGSGVCGRCGTSLGLATAVIEVHPPRAGRMRKRLRRVVPARRVYRELRDVITDAGAASTAVVRRTSPDLPPFPLLWRLLLPGWSQSYAGRKTRGRIFLGGFLICLLPGLIGLGTTWGSIFLGLAFSVHSSAALDIVTRRTPDVSMAARIRESLFLSATLFLLLYWPAAWALTRVADPHTLASDVGPFHQDDVVLVNHLARPGPGRLVLYELPPNRFVFRGRWHGYVQIGGERIDRVLAGPGDHARWINGRLSVNGRGVPLRPLDTSSAPNELDLTLHDGQFFILPNSIGGGMAAIDSERWPLITVIPRDAIRGIVYARTHPLERLGFIR